MFKHLQEVYLRALFFLISLIVLILLSFYYKNVICFFLVKPFIDITFINNYMYTGILDLVYIYIKIILVFSLFFIFPLLLYILLTFIKKGLYLFELIKVKLYFNFNLFLFYFIVFLLYIKVIPLVSLLFIAEQDNKYNFFSLNLEILIIKYLDYLLFLLFILIGFYILILIIFFLLQKNRYICFNRFFLSLFLIGWIIFLLPPIFFLHLICIIGCLVFIDFFLIYLKFYNFIFK